MGQPARIAASLSRGVASCLAAATLLLGLIAPTSPLSADTPSYQLSLSVTRNDGASGSVTDNTGNLSCTSTCSTDSWGYKSGTVVILTASPGSGTTFQGWGGACSGTALTC